MIELDRFNTVNNNLVAYIEVDAFFAARNGKAKPFENPVGKQHFIDIVDETLQTNKFFENYGFDRYVEKEADYTFDVEFINYGSLTAATLSGLISGATLTLLPAVAKDGYLLKVDVIKNGKTIKSYNYDDYIRTWIHLFLIFKSKTAKTVPKETISNMFNHFLVDFEKDFL